MMWQSWYPHSIYFCIRRICDLLAHVGGLIPSCRSVQGSYVSDSVLSYWPKSLEMHHHARLTLPAPIITHQVEMGICGVQPPFVTLPYLPRSRLECRRRAQCCKNKVKQSWNMRKFHGYCASRCRHATRVVTHVVNIWLLIRPDGVRHELDNRRVSKTSSWTQTGSYMITTGRFWEVTPSANFNPSR